MSAVLKHKRTIDWSHAVAGRVPQRDPEQEPKDFAVRLRVRNGRLLAAIARVGFTDLSAFCRGHKLNRQQLDGYVNMREQPYSAITALPKLSAQRLADALNMRVEELFPQRLLAAALKNASRPIDMNLSDEQIEDFLYQPPVTPEQYLQLSEARKAIDRGLNTLMPREERMLRLNFGLVDDDRERPLGAIAAESGVSTPRATQIVNRALRKLKHPSRAYNLLDAARTFGMEWAYSPHPSDVPPAPEYVAPPRMRPNPPPEEEAVKLSRRRLFPDEKPDKPHPGAVLHECSPEVITLLRIPEASRNDAIKRAIAVNLELEFGRRGAGWLRVNTDGLSSEQVLLRKYDYLTANLDGLWTLFPPAPDLTYAADG